MTTEEINSLFNEPRQLIIRLINENEELRHELRKFNYFSIPISVQKTSYFDKKERKEKSYITCPTCLTPIGRDNILNYCSNCGQHLKN